MNAWMTYFIIQKKKTKISPLKPTMFSLSVLIHNQFFRAVFIRFISPNTNKIVSQSYFYCWSILYLLSAFNKVPCHVKHEQNWQPHDIDRIEHFQVNKSRILFFIRICIFLCFIHSSVFRSIRCFFSQSIHLLLKP